MKIILATFFFRSLSFQWILFHFRVLQLSFQMGEFQRLLADIDVMVFVFISILSVLNL